MSGLHRPSRLAVYKVVLGVIGMVGVALLVTIGKHAGILPKFVAEGLLVFGIGCMVAVVITPEPFRRAWFWSGAVMGLAAIAIIIVMYLQGW